MQDSSVIIALLSLIGTLAGTFGGIVVSNRLTTYRIEQLEAKVNEHNKIITRTFKLEEQQALNEKEFKVLHHRIERIEEHYENQN